MQLCRSILLLGDDAVKFLKSELLVGVSLIKNVSVVHHLLNLLIGHCFSQLATNFLNLLKVN